MRILLVLLMVLLACFVYLHTSTLGVTEELPVFLRTDQITGAHTSHIEVCVQSRIHPPLAQLVQLKEDYRNIWAHLNHLYATNDIEAGKQYYTEDWFRQINRNHKQPQTARLLRTDQSHTLHLMNWSSDGLVCTAVDSSVILQYQYPDHTYKTTIANIAIVLLFQGDHWRIDAIRIIDESILLNSKI